MKKLSLTKDEKRYCESLLSNWRTLVSNLTDPEMTENTIRKLIFYEATTKQRMDVLNRLAGRYYKLRRQREWEELMVFINESKKGSKRIKHREVFKEAC